MLFVLPWDDAPNLLLTAVGKADNTGARYNADRTYPLHIGHGPILIESIEAIELSTMQAKPKVWKDISINVISDSTMKNTLMVREHIDNIPRPFYVFTSVKKPI